VNTLALADLVQVSAMNHRTCQIHVIAPHAEGDLFLERGSVVHAWWGDLVGAEAVYAMLNTPDVGFTVRPDVAIEAQTIACGWQQLVLEAARRFDHGSVPQPTRRSSDRWRTLSLDDAPTPRPALTPPPATKPASSGPPRALWWFATGLCAVALGLLAGRLLAGRFPGTTRAAAAIAPAVPTMTPLDATDLTGAGDALPQLLDGVPPEPPHAGLAVTPTIVCRLTIGADGVVRDSRVYRSRLDLAAYEDAALAAVERYRFRPAQHHGAPVAVTINWPVGFAAGAGDKASALRIKGSDTIGGALGPALARAFHERRRDVDVTVEALGSKTAFVGLFDGSADLGASSRPVNADELAQAARLGVTLREYVLAYDGIAVIVHPGNGLRGLTLDEVAQIFTGRVRNWSAVGGDDAPITVLSRPSYSGTHAFFRDKVLRHGDPKATDDFAPGARAIEDNRELLRAVAADEHAIAFVGHGWLSPAVRALPIAPARAGAGVLPTVATIRNGSYPIYRPLLFYTRGAPSRDVAAFLRFALGADGQAIVRAQGFVPLDAPAAGVVGAGDPSATESILEPLRIGFSAGNARLADDARARLAELARNAHGGRFLVVGHSDAQGNVASNHRLALARGERVAAQLVTLGIAPEAITTEADDSDAPVASNDSIDGRRANRRADVFVLPR
jgi:phosphate binding protein